MSSTVTAAVVSYAEPEATRAAVRSLRAQTTPPGEILVVDNHEDALLGGDAGEGARVLRLEGNVGYTRACNAAAEAASGDWLLFLNPDAVAEPEALARLLAAAQDPDVAIVGAQILLPDGTVNAGENPLHVSGLSWSGRYGEPREHGAPRDVAGVSGAALLVRREDYRRLGGMCPRFFLYGDDADLCWRARIAGRRVVFCPEAAVVHAYEFEGGARKWFWLERNRLWSVLANYSARSLVVLAPVLLVTEAGTLALALRGGWAREKLRGWADLVRAAGELRRWRRAVQGSRRVPDRRLITAQTATMDTPLVSHPLLRLANPLLGAYVRVARRAL